MNDHSVVILVYSTSHAMRIERLLQQIDVACKMTPVPRHLSSDCGVCIQIRSQDRDKAKQTIAAEGIEINGIYPL